MFRLITTENRTRLVKDALYYQDLYEKTRDESWERITPHEVCTLVQAIEMAANLEDVFGALAAFKKRNNHLLKGRTHGR